jgi:hypothetical protein
MHYNGAKRYEITNHLGNVLATITDRRIPYQRLSRLADSVVF